jgi:hypothetical protein
VAIEHRPAFDELLARTDAPPGSSWGLWGPDDTLGCLNLITPERVVRSARLVRTGRRFPLDLPLHEPDPPLFGRRAFRHDVIWLAHEGGHDETLSDLNPQGSSQWDGFRHIRSRAHGFYNGVADEAHGAHHWAEAGIVTRGVLADLGRWRAAAGRPLSAGEPDVIEPDEVTACLAEQGVAVEQGDILLLRTGWLTWYRGLDRAVRAELSGRVRSCGLRPGRDSARMLWDLGIAAVAADNPALEAMPVAEWLTPEHKERLRAHPEADAEVFLHVALLPLLGMPIGELWNLDELAADCAGDGVYEFQLVSTPLHLRGGVGSTANAVAVK